MLTVGIGMAHAHRRVLKKVVYQRHLLMYSRCLFKNIANVLFPLENQTCHLQLYESKAKLCKQPNETRPSRLLDYASTHFLVFSCPLGDRDRDHLSGQCTWTTAELRTKLIRRASAPTEHRGYGSDQRSQVPGYLPPALAWD